MEYARFNVLTKKNSIPEVVPFPPISANLVQHIIRAHLQVRFWKAYTCVKIYHKVWMRGLLKAILLLIQCQCKAQGK